MTDQKGAEVDSLYGRLERLEADLMPNERFANKSLTTSPFYLSVAADLPLWPSLWIVQLGLE